MAEQPMPYEMALAFGDLTDAARESKEAFRRATVAAHHLRLRLEELPQLGDDESSESRT